MIGVRKQNRHVLYHPPEVNVLQIISWFLSHSGWFINSYILHLLFVFQRKKTLRFTTLFSCYQPFHSNYINAMLPSSFSTWIYQCTAVLHCEYKHSKILNKIWLIPGSTQRWIMLCLMTFSDDRCFFNI